MTIIIFSLALELGRPKDPRFLLEAAMKNNLEFTTIQNALEINSKIPLYICDKIEDRLNEL